MRVQSHKKRTLFALALLLSGCGRCSSPTTESNEPTKNQAPRPLPPMLGPPAPLNFKPFRAARSGVALPSGCQLRDLISEATLPPMTRFVAEPRTLGMLLVAQAQGDPPKLSGVAALSQSSLGEMKNPKPFPWFVAEDMPIFTRTEEQGFMAANEVELDESNARVELWRDGMAETLGEGDQFHAVDIACSKEQCALLSTRMAKVAVSGATLWIGHAKAPLSQWKSIEIVPPAGDVGANPIGFAHGALEYNKNDQQMDRVSTGSNTQAIAEDISQHFPPPIVLTTKTSLVFYRAGEGLEPSEIARLPAPHGTLDILSAPLPIAMVYGNPVNESGCIARPEKNEPIPAEEELEEPPQEADAAPAPAAEAQSAPTSKGALIRFERAGSPGIEIAVPTPPVLGVLRPIEQGVLALWIASLGCGHARRVVYGLVLDNKGTPLSSPIPIADAELFAAASSGNTVDLWLQRESVLSFVPLRCSLAPKP